MKQDTRFYTFTLGIRGTDEQVDFWKEMFLKLIRDGINASYISFSFSAQDDAADDEDED